MKKLVAVFFLMFCISCMNSESQSASGKRDSSSISETNQVPIIADSVLKEMGLLKEVEDSGYPFTTLTIEFPERKFKEYFIINLEEAKGADLGTIQKWVGSYVSFTYTSELTNALLDVQKEGKSVISTEKTDLNPALKKIVGVLKGADEETLGDLPSKVSIANNDKTLEFPFFVTKEMVEANGSDVVGFYDERTQNSIKTIKLLPK